MTDWTVVVIGVMAFVSLVLIVRLHFLLNGLNSSIAKLSYVIREDAKKYFDDAGEKIVDTNEHFQSMYTKIVHDGTMSALTNAETVLKDTISSAHRESNEIILIARNDAQNIIAAAKNDAEKQYDDAVNRSVDTIRWVIEQYTDRQLTVDQHEAIIRHLLEEYLRGHQR